MECIKWTLASHDRLIAGVHLFEVNMYIVVTWKKKMDGDTSGKKRNDGTSEKKRDDDASGKKRNDDTSEKKKGR